MEKSKQFYRQGDVFFIPLIPERHLTWQQQHTGGVTEDKLTAGERKDGVIARGETTGHAHRIDPANMSRRDALLATLSGVVGMVLRVKAPTKIVHEEHGTVELPAGDYLVRQQQEFDPLLRQRYVCD